MVTDKEYKTLIDIFLNGTPEVSIPRNKAGKRFPCTNCGVTVYTKRNNIFSCNGCKTEYEGIY